MRLNWLTIVWAFVAAWLAVVITLSAFAPIPPAKKRQRPAIPGRYVMHFHGTPWPTVLLDDGGYCAERVPGPRYEGSWTLHGDVFTIRERFVSSEGAGGWTTYTFHLRPGRVDSVCGGLRLERLP